MELSRTMERHFLGNLSASGAQDIRLHGRRDLRMSGFRCAEGGWSCRPGQVTIPYSSLCPPALKTSPGAEDLFETRHACAEVCEAGGQRPRVRVSHAAGNG